jgi:hypothetical protein
MGFAQVVVKDQSRDTERLCVFVLDWAVFVAIYEMSIAQKDVQLKVRRYGWNVSRSRGLLYDIRDRETGNHILRYVCEFADE